MLPGGLLVLGVFMIATPELAKDGQNALRKVSGVPTGRTATYLAVCVRNFLSLTWLKYSCFVALFHKPCALMCGFETGMSEIPVLWDTIC